MSTKQDLAEETTREEESAPSGAAAEAPGSAEPKPALEQTSASTSAPPKTADPETADPETAERKTADPQTADVNPSEARTANGKADDPTTADAGAGDLTGGDPAEGDGGEGDARRRGAGGGARWRGMAIGAVLALVLATAGVTAVVQWISADRLQSRLAPLEHDRLLRLDVSGAASAFATTLLSYDYKDLQTTRGKVIAMTAGDFLATYDEAFGGPMEQVIVKLEAVSKATVREVYLSEVDDASAKALVSVDQQVTSKEAVRNVLGTHLKMVMIKQKGVWKVSDVTVLGAAKETETKLDKKG
ncbi:hypothetical protein [Nonomuraea sp. bgisy101]|uniref:hypothetical protein n=1 Tax=Nonomuraea sp. bgisy101 TaxID=3413784 RepID=UPI003D74451F